MAIQHSETMIASSIIPSTVSSFSIVHENLNEARIAAHFLHCIFKVHVLFRKLCVKLQLIILSYSYESSRSYAQVGYV